MWALIADGTQDVSKKEVITQVIRYLESSDELGQLPAVVERLLKVFAAHKTSGAELKDSITGYLRHFNIPLHDLVGQSYDGAGNMRGKLKGLKTLLQEVAPKAEYVWCNSHRFNLVINAACSSSIELKNALGLMEELHVFIATSAVGEPVRAAEV